VRILFDQGVPVPLRKFLKDHDVATAHERGWSKLTNGELLDVAEQQDYDVLVTTDANLKHQQNLTIRRLGFVVLVSTSWPRIHATIDSVVEKINAAAPGTYIEVEVP
jgi:predicted nuclease of predicted toxin-antitoxin system